MTAIPAGQDVTGTRRLKAWRERVVPPADVPACRVAACRVAACRVAARAAG